MSIFNSIKNFFKNFFYKHKKQTSYFKNTLIVENNSSIKPLNNTITIVKKNNTYLWVKFICPCGCGREVVLSLNPSIKPYWKLKINNKNKVTLLPSVYLTGFSCKSHFFIRDNRIDWI